MAKPFSVPEFHARVARLMRRAYGVDVAAEAVRNAVLTTGRWLFFTFVEMREKKIMKLTTSLQLFSSGRQG